VFTWTSQEGRQERESGGTASLCLELSIRSRQLGGFLQNISDDQKLEKGKEYRVAMLRLVDRGEKAGTNDGEQANQKKKENGRTQGILAGGENWSLTACRPWTLGSAGRGTVSGKGDL